MHRFHARRSARARPATGFVSQPEPKTIGHFARGRQLISGNFLFAGAFVQAPNALIWDIGIDNPRIAEEIQGFAWLDDLAAVGDMRARERAQAWVADWIARYGTGVGPGWTPDLTGRRLIRWINHGLFLLRGQDKAASDIYFRSLGQQTLFLAKRWRTTEPGLSRFEALTGIIYAGLALEGMEQFAPPAVKALASDCATQIDSMGGIATRNPEDLLEVFTLITWATQALTLAGQTPPRQFIEAQERMAPTLRALRHADGSLARFHGGGRGIDGRLDHALADSHVRVTPIEPKDLHMGFARVTAGRTSMIIDAATPPVGPASGDAHASTLAFEVTSGRRPIIVSCGSGRSFGEDWRRAGRATPSHSTLWINGYSSSRLAPPVRGSHSAELLLDVPQRVQCEFSNLDDGKRLELSHDGYRQTHGLTHARTIDIAIDGRGLVGEDLLTTLGTNDEARFDGQLSRSSPGVPFTIRFHLHPDVDATVDLSGGAVSMVLKSGEVWIFRHDGQATLSLEPSVYLENGRLKPRSAQQVVLTSAAMTYATRVRWSLAKAQDTPDAVRDLTPNEPVGGYDDTSRGQ
ncbi:putative heparinase superfamily protein [Loktanella ponticola]|uniref:Putative heparinase superfamily protein n=1 Tax=Yoonia ponticola TaxID=1524255 RepID=A0A7W9EWA9_9RHOB|nr:heparinase II/III family protein [Yoonia ponticola]MBB5720502.1 putative heparinase superfamily protein [Yoonia ponticola]